jgi:O-antigen biosynthesis protein
VLQLGSTTFTAPEVEVASGGPLEGFGTVDAALSNTGTVETDGGTLQLADEVSGSGALRVDDNAVLEVKDGASGGTVVFDGADGTLQLDGPLNIQDAITGFAQTDAIDIPNLTATDASWSDGTLTVDTNFFPFTLALLGDYSGDTFKVTSDRHGGSDITIVPCHLAGMLIRTDRCEIAVEALAIGDRVVTHSAEAKSIKWIGRRAYAKPFSTENRDVIPIRFRTGSLGENIPVRDLYVSPHHAMFVDGVLVPAEALVNGVSVLRAKEIDPIRYFHVELAAHDVIFAEGAPAETFVDCDSRLMFHNAHEFPELYPGDSTAAWEFCAPHVEEGSTPRRIWRAVAERAGLFPGGEPPVIGHLDHADRGLIHGWAWMPERPDVPVELEILVDDGVIGRVTADRYRADLAARGWGHGRHRFELRLDLSLPVWRAHMIRVRRASDHAQLDDSPRSVPESAAANPLEDPEFSALLTQGAENAEPAELDAMLAVLTREAERLRQRRVAMRLRAGGGASPAEALLGHAPSGAARRGAVPGSGRW